MYEQILIVNQMLYILGISKRKLEHRVVTKKTSITFLPSRHYHQSNNIQNRKHRSMPDIQLVSHSCSLEFLTPRLGSLDSKVVGSIPVVSVVVVPGRDIRKGCHRRFPANKGHIKELVVAIIKSAFAPETTSSTAAPGLLLLVLSVMGRH